MLNMQFLSPGSASNSGGKQPFASYYWNGGVMFLVSFDVLQQIWYPFVVHRFVHLILHFKTQPSVAIGSTAFNGRCLSPRQSALTSQATVA
jgi:hypothetical protein